MGGTLGDETSGRADAVCPPGAPQARWQHRRQRPQHRDRGLEEVSDPNYLPVKKVGKQAHLSVGEKVAKGKTMRTWRTFLALFFISVDAWHPLAALATAGRYWSSTGSGFHFDKRGSWCATVTVTGQ